MWTVVLDTTALAGDYHLRSPAMRALLERARQEKFRLVIPEVVVREAVGRYRSELDDLDSQTRKLNQLSGRLGLGPAAVEMDLATEVAAYESHLRSELKMASAVIASPPEVAHLEVVDRAIQRRRPFKDSGVGYRDTLIWLTTLGWAEISDVVLVTKNHRDFAESDEEVSLVNGHLRLDLFRIGEKDDRVIVVRDPAAVVEYLFAADERLLAELQHTFPLTAEEAIALVDPVATVRWEPDLGLPDEAEILAATDFAPPPGADPDDDASWRLTVANAKIVAGDSALLELVIPVTASIDFLLAEDLVERRPEALRNYEPLAEGPLPDGRTLCRAHRQLHLRLLVAYDIKERRVTLAQLQNAVVHERDVAPKNAHLLGLTTGDRIRHKTFGSGVIASIQGEGPRTEADVDFEGAGRKRLLLAWAPIERCADS